MESSSFIKKVLETTQRTSASSCKQERGCPFSNLLIWLFLPCLPVWPACFSLFPFYYTVFFKTILYMNSEDTMDTWKQLQSSRTVTWGPSRSSDGGCSHFCRCVNYGLWGLSVVTILRTSDQNPPKRQQRGAISRYGGTRRADLRRTHGGGFTLWRLQTAEQWRMWRVYLLRLPADPLPEPKSNVRSTRRVLVSLRLMVDS